MTIVLLAVLASMNVQLKQSPKVISTKLIQKFARIVEHAQMYAR